MKKSDLPPGTKVLVCADYDEGEIVKYYCSEYGDEVIVGEVLDKPADAKHVVVKFEENDFDYEEEEVKVELLTLFSDRESIEAAFNTTTEKIKVKMKEAAKLVKEADRMARACHAKSLESMYEAVSPLIDAMDSSGWRSSSWGC